MSEYCIYLRKSRMDLEAEARGEGETLARHQSILMELAKRQELNIVKIYKEVVSGDSISARPQMQMLLSDLAQNKYEGVLVVEVERLARGDTIDQGIVAQAFKQSNTKIITPVKTYDPNNEFDEEYFEFSLFMSRREYKTIKRRLEAGRLATIKSGNHIGIPPYGYRRIQPAPKVHTLEIIPEEAEIVRLIYKLYLEGHGARYISTKLNSMGMLSAKGNEWAETTIRRILKNPVYSGKICWTYKKQSFVCQGKHQAIISEDIFNLVQDKIKNNPVSQVRSDDEFQNYYHGVLFCENCGHQMKRRFSKSALQTRIFCVQKQCQRKVVSSPIEEVDKAVLFSFENRINKIDELSISSEVKKEEIKPDQRKPIEAELDKSRKQKEKLYDLLEQGIYDANVFLERSKKLNDKIESLENALAEIESQIEPERLSDKELGIRLRYILENFEGATPEERNSMLKSVVRKMYYSKHNGRTKNKSSVSDLTIKIDFM